MLDIVLFADNMSSCSIMGTVKKKKGERGMPEVNLNDQQQKLAIRAKEAKTVRKIIFITTLVIVLIVAGVAAGGYFYISNALSPVDPDTEKQVKVDIKSGSSVTDIANKLESKGIIHDATVFRYYIKYKNENGFQAGSYQFSPSMKIDKIIEKLKEGKVYKEAAFKLTIREGVWMTDIAAAIADKTKLSKKEILNKMQDHKYIKETFLAEYPFLKKEAIFNKNIKYPLEGYLFPATYSIMEEQPSLEIVLKNMLDKTQAVLKNFQTEIENSKFSVHETMTLASLIEEEGTKQADRRKISSVFYNRLEKDWLLQTDPTVKYALQDKGRLSEKDLKTDSPFNTYENKTLPPGPISNPGKKSIQAAVNPKETEFMFFYARVSGEVLFSKTNEKHNQVVNKYRDEWDEYFKKQSKK